MCIRRYLPIFVCMLALGSVLPGAVQAQLEEIVVVGTRTEKRLGEIPLAVSLIDARAIQMGRQELGLDESLARVPGLFMQNRYNFAQDLRVSIRGFGSRASFGIRGIKVFADDIPLTLADGQSGTDDLDIGSAESIEVVRGPAASLYGSASGGVISLTTEDAPEDFFVEPKLILGEFGHEKYQVKLGGQTGRLNYLVNVSHLEMEGYRDHSELQHTLVNTKFRYAIDENSDITAVVNAVNSPTANDPGGITRQDVSNDRTQAQPRNVSSNAGESFDQQRFGLVYNKTFNRHHDLTVRGYSLQKDFKNFLPIGSHIPFVADDGVVAFDRKSHGGGARYTYKETLLGLANSLTLGFDLDIQKDDRQRFINNAGVQGERVFDQLEKAESLGLYFRDELALSDSVSLSLSGRFDNLDLSVDDRYLVNGDQSGSLEFDQFNPAAGLIWNVSSALNVYINYATSFETPTFTELGTPAQELNVNLGGFNNVSAQEAESFEIGAKGSVGDKVYYDLAIYTMSVDDEITNVVSVDNRAFFENADTDRQGVEAQIQTTISDDLDVTLSYTFSDFTFDHFQDEPDVAGGWIPGIPRHQFYMEADYTLPGGAYLIWDALFVGKLFADNANEERVDSYWVSNVRMGNNYKVKGTTLSPFVGINNLFDEKYFSNVRINAFGGRAFEPAPPRHVYGGVTVRF